jgi:hypothetical protein
MPPLADFVQQLLTHGAVVFQQRPTPAEPDPAVGELLARAFAEERLEVAGPPLSFRPAAALAAAVLMRDACWFLVCHDEPPEEVTRRLTLAPPQTAADHLSADLTLRYLPQVARRARLLNPADALSGLLATVLRHWPLSGVLADAADVGDGPLTPPGFDGHPGLLLLYAERLAAHEKPTWRPEGVGADFCDLVNRRPGRRVQPAATGGRRDG